MKIIKIICLFIVVAINVSGQTSKSELSGFWDAGSSWVGGAFPGSVASGIITATTKVIVVDGTTKTNKGVTLDLSSLTINSGDTLVILGNLVLTTSSIANNGVLVVLGNVTNNVSNSVTSGSGKLVVTGNYANALGTANTFTGPSYVYGSTSGFLFSPSVNTKANLISSDPSLYTWVSGMNTALPIELISFNAVADGGYVMLSWSTATEINNDHFIIERSADGMTFEVITSPNGAGNSKEIKSYSYSDTDPLIGKSYYRLSQVDYDGRTEQFHIVYIDAKNNSLKIYPNPSTEYLLINASSDEYSFVINDLKGLSSSNDNALQEVLPGKAGINVSDLRPGIYYLELTNNKDGSSTIFRFIKS